LTTVELVNYFVGRGHEMILKGKRHDRYDDRQEQKDQGEGPGLFPDELIDRLLAQVQQG
jgi:hypothetical protein